MTFTVSNKSDTDVYLTINNKAHFIKKDAIGIYIDSEKKRNEIKVNRAVTIPPPPYKKVFLTYLLGILYILFAKQWRYIADVSSTCVIDGFDKNVEITITRIVNEKSAEFIYDIISIDSSFNASPSSFYYSVENKYEIRRIYDKSRKIAFFWSNITVIILFSLLGMVVSSPVWLLVKNVLESEYINVLFVIIPTFWIIVVTLIVILPLHFFHKYENRSFYKCMEHKEIVYRISLSGKK